MAKSQIRQYIFTPGTAGNGKVLIAGKYDLNQILLITNSTSNSIIYNFADSTNSGTAISFTRANDAVNFPYALDNSDGITTITFAIDTSAMSSTDKLQILYERPFQDVRMPEAGTDAWERTRVANPQSMLDADFEYGLQPTKWLTYDLIRGYPSIYEIPGTDQSVTSVTTDASTGTGGVGESLITVTNSTAFPVSWTVGSPITIKGYLNTISGFARAEGSFIINSISGNVLTYFAKAKVGVNNGDVLSSTYTQLRQGSFYTGASIGSPTYTYVNPTAAATSSSATIGTANTTFLGGITGTTLTTSSGTPAIGQVLSGGNITPGTYIVSGGGTSWVVSPTQVTATSGGTTITAVTNTLTTSGTITGVWAIGQAVSGSTTQTGTTIIALGTGTGSNVGGTYYVNTAQTVGAAALSGTTGQGTVTVTFATNHGFVPGATIISQVSSDALGNNNALAQGPFFVESVPNAVSITFTMRSSGIVTGTITGVIYARPDAFYQHRPFDGGVMLGTGGPAYGSMAVRMSKKYIRYQSGKAINYNTGALFAPNYDIRSISASGTSIGSIITVITDDTDHGLQVGAQINIIGVTTTGYNGVYSVATIVDERTFTVLATSVLGSATGAIQSPCTVQVVYWTGSTVRAGTFDEQNGSFWQYDGQTISIGRRSSTFQIAGSVSVVPDSNLITGSNSRFTSQLAAGDRVVIKGMTHVVTSVVSDTQIYVNPDYRGSVAATGVKMVKTIDRLVPQSAWNMDRCDGSNSVYNPSGYNILINKMQMIGLQWTWYGSGFTDWMMRGPDGKYITVHRLRGNNLNTEAYMRSGNQPVRYEVVNESARSAIAGNVAVAAIDTVVPLVDATFFPTAGTVYVDNEIITFNGKINTYATATAAATGYVTVASSAGMTAGQPIVFTSVTGLPMGNIVSGTTYYVNSVVTSTTITLSNTSSLSLKTQVDATGYMTTGAIYGCLRAQSLSVFAAGASRTFTAAAAATHNVNTGVVLVGQTATPSISHWGSAFITDGGFDQDRGYIFNYQSINTQISTRKTTAFAIRLAPSVSNAIVGDLGVRDLINRAQLLLQTIEITVGGSTNTNSAVVIEGILNPQNYPTNVSNITWNSLNSTALQTGQPSFSQIAAGTSVIFQSNATNTPTTTIAYPIGATTIVVSNATGINVADDVFFPGALTAVLGLTKVASVTTVSPTYTGSTVTSPTASTATATITGTVLTTSSVPTNTGFIVGAVITGSGVAAGTYITAILSGTATGSGSTFQVSVSQTVASGTLTATAYQLTTTGVTGTLTAGMLLTGGAVTANTYIISQFSGTAGGAGVYNVNQTYTGTPTGATGVVIVLNQALQSTISAGTPAQFSRYTYAIPGETVFSFISSPSNKDSLDLTPFKELTNTPIGGRGTFPNGPDVLFINVYLTQGAPVLANLVLRWGEAQA
jgi:hypothetical protein